MVFFSHCFLIGPYFENSWWEEGYVGVSFFFVLSGFIIAYNYRDKLKQGVVTKRQFWVARIARIYPLHILTLCGIALVGGYVASDMSDWIKHFLPNLFLVHAFIPFHEYYFSFNGPSWSLGGEQLFYFLFPFLALFFAPSNKRLYWVIGALIVLTPIAMFFTSEEYIRAVWYVNPLTRLFNFILGMFLFALYDKHRNINWSGSKATFYEVGVLALFILSCIFAVNYIPQVYRYSYYYWLPISLLIFVFAHSKGMLSRALSNKCFVALGKISFSFYLIHFLALKAYAKLMGYLGGNIPEQFGAVLVLIVVILLSAISYCYFEKPTDRLVKRLFK